MKPSLIIKLQHNAFGCFSSNMRQGGGREAKQMRFPRKCETSFVGDAFIHSLLTMRDAVYSQLTHNARYSRFPPKFYYLQTKFPCLMLHSSKCNFTCHTQAKGRWFWKIVKIVWSTDTIYENSLVHRYYLSDRLKLSLLDTVGCFRFNSSFCLTVCVCYIDLSLNTIV